MTTEHDNSSATETSANAAKEKPYATSTKAQTPLLGAMSVSDHLAELRQRIIVSVSSILVSAMLAFVFARPMMNALKTLAPDTVTFIQIAPGEVLLTSFKLSIYAGMAIALPVLLFQVLAFVLPGLNAKEKSHLFWITLGGSALFIAGVAFSWVMVVPSAMHYLMDYGSDVAISQISIAQYMSFTLALLALTGITFELPMVLFFLSLTGLISSTMLIQQWRYAIVLIAITAAVMTPSQDPFTMLIVGGAMLALYAISIVPIKLCGR